MYHGANPQWDVTKKREEVREGRMVDVRVIWIWEWRRAERRDDWPSPCQNLGSATDPNKSDVI